MAGENVLSALNEFIKEAVLAAVREELAAYKEEVNKLGHMLTVVEERNGSIAAVMEERERELAAMKQELAEHKQSIKLQFEEAEKRRVAEMREMRGQVEEREELVAVRREVAAVKEEHKIAERGRESDLRELKGEAGNGEDEFRTELASERDERRDVQEVERREADLIGVRGMVEQMERELAAVKGKLAAKKDAGMKVDVDLQISQTGGDERTAWQRGSSMAPHGSMAPHDSTLLGGVAEPPTAAAAAAGVVAMELASGVWREAGKREV
ncbi:unnamed protein product [Closterium sp. NIES-65]|nr:unnamed protein product [Closterium sp. NIES-65]